MLQRMMKLGKQEAREANAEFKTPPHQTTAAPASKWRQVAALPHPRPPSTHGVIFVGDLSLANFNCLIKGIHIQGLLILRCSLQTGSWAVITGVRAHLQASSSNRDK